MDTGIPPFFDAPRPISSPSGDMEPARSWQGEVRR